MNKNLDTQVKALEKEGLNKIFLENVQDHARSRRIQKKRYRY